METRRRFLPSLSLLAAFDAVLRTGSTIAAARDLQLSQATVSRLIQNLEGQLGRPLFHRVRKRLVPTDAAHLYGKDIRTALDLIQRASMRVSANLGGGTLALAILPSIGTRWLAPRLGAFLSANPGVTINLSTRIRPFDFRTEEFDAAVYFGPGGWQDTGQLKLFDERLTACASPTLLANLQLCGPADVMELPLFRLETRPLAWRTWFAAQGAPDAAPPATGMMFDQFAPMIEAAIAGLGVALLPDYLATAEFAEGRLAPVLTPSVPGIGAYWLVWPNERAAYPPLLSFRRWLETELADRGASAHR